MVETEKLTRWLEEWKSKKIWEKLQGRDWERQLGGEPDKSVRAGRGRAERRNGRGRAWEPGESRERRND